MKIVEIIPFTRSAFAPTTLSYFSTKNIGRGDLVKINFRGKETFAIVEKTKELADKKSEVKKSRFALKPIAGIVKEKFLAEEWFSIFEVISKGMLISPSVVLTSLFPKALLNPKSAAAIAEAAARRHRKITAKGTGEERMQHLRSLVREHFARKKSIMILAPRIETLKKLEQGLARGIEKYAYVFSSEILSRKYLDNFNKAQREEHPVLVLGTYQALTFDRPDLETLVMEEEGSRLWREREGLPFDVRNIAQIIAAAKGWTLIFSDQILRIETIYYAEQGKIEASGPLSGRIQSAVETRLIEIGEKKENFSWISKELEQELEESIFKNEKILLFVNRKGYSSFTLCQDCSRAQLCPNCSTPFALHAPGTKERKFLCHHCLKPNFFIACNFLNNII